MMQFTQTQRVMYWSRIRTVLPFCGADRVSTGAGGPAPSAHPLWSVWDDSRNVPRRESEHCTGYTPNRGIERAGWVVPLRTQVVEGPGARPIRGWSETSGGVTLLHSAQCEPGHSARTTRLG